MHDSLPVSEDDFNALLELLDEDTMREVVTLFLASAPDRLGSARSGVASGDGRVAASAFHALRSGCGQLGARHLEALCADGERRAKAGDFAGAADSLAAAEAEYERCRVWFRGAGWVAT